MRVPALACKSSRVNTTCSTTELVGWNSLCLGQPSLRTSPLHYLPRGHAHCQGPAHQAGGDHSDSLSTSKRKSLRCQLCLFFLTWPAFWQTEAARVHSILTSGNTLPCWTANLSSSGQSSWPSEVGHKFTWSPTACVPWKSVVDWPRYKYARDIYTKSLFLSQYSWSQFLLPFTLSHCSIIQYIYCFSYQNFFPCQLNNKAYVYREYCCRWDLFIESPYANLLLSFLYFHTFNCWKMFIQQERYVHNL